MKCIKCGLDNSESAMYCSGCGEKFSIAATGGSGIEGMSVARLVLYTVFTAGIYAPIWLMKRVDGFNALNSEEKLTHGPLGFILAICIVNVGVVLYASFVEAGAGGNVFMWVEPESPFMKNMVATVHMLDTVFKVMLLFQCIKVRRIIIDHMEANGLQGKDEMPLIFMVLWGLFFPAVYYLQYKLNRVELSSGVADRMDGFKVD